MLEPGQIFATRYRVVRLLARGGMGAVFEAEHLGTEARLALKLLWPHVLGLDSARQKFELEAKVAARVRSQHIVQVLDAGFDPETQSPYLAMELLAGESLAQRLERTGPLEATEALSVMRQVARGLDAAHGYADPLGNRSAIVHRDLKPENLFVTRDERGEPLVKILDFGIAKALSESTHVSQEVRGTPLYMAYEQVVADPVSPRTDVWAFGLVTYVLLTGRCYWKAAEAGVGGVQALFAEIISLPMTPPRERLAALCSHVRLPAAFDAWFLRCLDRNPARRFESAGEAVEALSAAFDAEANASSPRSDAPASATLLGTPAATRNATSPTAASASGMDRARAGELSSTSLPAVSSEHASTAPRRSTTTRRGIGRGAGFALGALSLVGAAVWWPFGTRGDATPPVAGSPPSREPVSSTPRRAERREPPAAPSAVAAPRVQVVGKAPELGEAAIKPETQPADPAMGAIRVGGANEARDPEAPRRSASKPASPRPRLKPEAPSASSPRRWPAQPAAAKSAAAKSAAAKSAAAKPAPAFDPYDTR